ncbi:type II toxin-antitoxin system prevent-host-death family antitoxin [Kineosporia sp. A_224]|uniref:type II toxin-antitoxin system prevent-host-death family antitoxin n=1 Tax=Kineosporia sp. A_224 TaxID=1962180 RepID=UPI000B4BF51E|nr:type II toxin-antitoxin system prevent-host-death family antitoxin [Kineosporia sp. A_224]
MTDLPVSEVAARLEELVAGVVAGRGRVTVTQPGVPAAVLLSAEELDELEEAAAVADYYLRRSAGTQISVSHEDAVRRLRRKSA